MKKHIHGGDIYTNQDCLDFSANCNPFGVPKRVLEAVKQSLSQIIYYPQVGYAPLKKAIANYEKVDASEIICGNGAAELIYTVCRAIEPKRAMIPIPTFAEYEAALTSVNCEIQYYDMKPSYQLTEDFLDVLDSDIDVVFLCNPNNPTGLLLPEGLLFRIMKKCQEQNIFLVVDECFLDFTEQGESYSLKKYMAENKGLFLLKAFTKRYAMAGIRLGYGLCGNQEVLDKMEACNQPWNLSVLAQAAGVQALQEEEYVKKSQALVNEERKRMKEALRILGFEIFDSVSNYIFFHGPENFYEVCKEDGILIRDCSNYTGLKKGFYRIAIRMPEENNKLLEVFQKHSPKTEKKENENG